MIEEADTIDDFRGFSRGFVEDSIQVGMEIEIEKMERKGNEKKKQEIETNLENEVVNEVVFQVSYENEVEQENGCQNEKGFFDDHQVELRSLYVSSTLGSIDLLIHVTSLHFVVSVGTIYRSHQPSSDVSSLLEKEKET